MSKVKKLSAYLGVPDSRFEELGIFDPFVGIDTHLFLDPALLKETKIPEFKNSYSRITKHFGEILRLLHASRTKFDIAWREAVKRLIFRETKGISIGYGANTSDGSAVGLKLAKRIAETADEILKLGSEDPAIFELICLFEKDLGADRLSDMMISIIKDDIYAYTDQMVTKLELRSEQILAVKTSSELKYKLIQNPLNIKRPLLLLPRELLKDLPTALTRDDIGYIVYFNENLRKKISALLLKDAAKSLKDVTKEDYRELFFTKKEMGELVDSYKKQKPEKYDFSKDPSGEVSWYEKGKKFAKNFPLAIAKKHPKTLEDVNDIVRSIIAQFKKNVESNELYELLYKEPISKLKPRNERYAQRLFYSIADAYCEANDIVLSREPNAGNGPVDFKIASDYRTQVLVEIKLSSGKVRNGFEKQLPEYEKNESADSSFYVILRVTQSSPQIDDVVEKARIAGEEKKHVPEVIVINALPRESASKKPRKK